MARKKNAAEIKEPDQYRGLVRLAAWPLICAPTDGRDDCPPDWRLTWPRSWSLSFWRISRSYSADR
jgi:hypothetical protein